MVALLQQKMAELTTRTLLLICPDLTGCGAAPARLSAFSDEQPLFSRPARIIINHESAGENKYLGVYCCIYRR